LAVFYYSVFCDREDIGGVFDEDGGTFFIGVCLTGVTALAFFFCSNFYCSEFIFFYEEPEIRLAN